MRSFPAAFLLGATAIALASPASAQPADRYGGYRTYQTPTPQAAPRPPAQPVRVLAWPGKSVPGAPAPQVQTAPTYAPPQAAPQSAAMPAPDPRQFAPAPQATAPVQPYGLPYQPYFPPGAPTPTPGSTATAPNGVFPPNTVPPQYAYPMAPAQQVTPWVNGQPLPASIYARPQAALPAADAPQRLASAAAPAQGPRLYSLHREFGLHPDPTPAPVQEGQAVELVSSIDSGGPLDPAQDGSTTVRTRQTDASGKTTTRTARLSGVRSDN